MIEVLTQWVNGIHLGGIDIYKCLNDDKAMHDTSKGFSQRSNGIFKGAIGALDGWLVQIIKPSYFRDGFKNVTGFFSRKGFYALNVQCIVDDKKRVLWFSYRHKGGLHDSTCFRDTKLYDHLKEVSSRLLDKGFFIIGDSAYYVESFLIPPYDNAASKSAEDDFNFFHSSAIITVECAFGEIDLRWGIFCKRLTFSLENATIIIEGAMRLHNYLVNYRLNNKTTSDNDGIIETNIFQQDILNSNAMPVIIGNGMGRPKENISNDECLNRMKGCIICDTLKIALQDHDMHRPKRNEWYSRYSSHTYRK